MSGKILGNMSKPTNCKHCEAERSIENGLESLLYTTSIRVQYYRSFNYCLKRKMPMYLRQSSRLKKASKEEFQGSPSPSEASVHPKWTKQKRALCKTRTDDSGADTDEERDRDILDIIGSSYQEHDNGGDEDCGSVSSSISSGPSVPHGSTKKLRPSQGLCSACWNLYKKAKKPKAPIKNKLFDNDPKSLTCDQWVLLKQWRPKRVLKTRGNLLTNVYLVKKKLVKRDAERTKRSRIQTEQPVCIRQHVFLQRNLKEVLKVPGRQRNRRKRPRNDSLGPRVAKQRCLHSSELAQPARHDIPEVKTVNGGPDLSSSQSTSSGFDGWSEQEMDGPEEARRTVELVSSFSVKESSNPQEVRAKPKAPKKTAGFSDLLAQLRENPGVIVREKC